MLGSRLCIVKGRRLEKNSMRLDKRVELGISYVPSRFRDHLMLTLNFHLSSKCIFLNSYAL